MLSLPVHLGGLGNKNPTVSAGLEYKLSCQTSKPLVEMLKNQNQEDVILVCGAVTTLRREARAERKAVEAMLAFKKKTTFGDYSVATI